MSEDCYFFIDMDVEVQDEGDRCIDVLCIECRDSLYPGVGWFWDGSLKGYGPWTYNCCKCNKLIHKPNEMEQNENKESL